MRIRWTHNLLRRAADLSAEGYGATDIAVRLGFGRQGKDAVASAMSRYGLFARPRPARQMPALIAAHEVA